MEMRSKLILIALSVIALMSALLIPGVFFNVYDSKLINSVHTEEFSGLPEFQENELDIWSRLMLVCGYGNDTNITLTDKNEMENINEESIISETIKEIEIMQRMGVFPNIDLNKENYIVTEAISNVYSDSSSLDKYVKLNILEFASNNTILRILKDAETNKIYQYELNMSNSGEGMEESIIGKNLSEYLGISLANFSFIGDYPVKFATEDRNIRFEISVLKDSVSVKLL